MSISDMLEELLKKAQKEENIKKQLLDTRKEVNPLTAFCRKCRELGYEIYEMDLINEGEEMYAAMKRSTNGGGENSPMLEGEDDYYEMFLASLDWK